MVLAMVSVSTTLNCQMAMLTVFAREGSADVHVSHTAVQDRVRYLKIGTVLGSETDEQLVHAECRLNSAVAAAEADSCMMRSGHCPRIRLDQTEHQGLYYP